MGRSRKPHRSARQAAVRDRARACVEAGGLNLIAEAGVAWAWAEGHARLRLGEHADRAEEQALRRVLRDVLHVGLGQEPSAEALKVARDVAAMRIEEVRERARQQREDAAAAEELRRKEHAAAIQERIDAGDRMGALELHLEVRSLLGAMRARAGVPASAPLVDAVTAYAASAGLEDGAEAAAALVAEVTSAPEAVNAPEEDAARRLLGLTTFERSGSLGETAPLQAQYEERSGGLVRLKPEGDGVVAVLLANFTARITGEILRDDGSGVPTLVFEIAATMSGRTAVGMVPASQFSMMNWPVTLLGAGACLSAGYSARDRAREAIQRFSGEPPRRTVYLHTGWREIGGRQVFLHGGGALGPDGPIDGVVVELAPSLAPLVLSSPASGDALRAAFRASLSLLDVAGDAITCLGQGAVYRAVLPIPAAEMSVFLTGKTGALKSSLLVLWMQHLGKGWRLENLPNWSWTANALEALLFQAKDVPAPVDDAAPDGSPADRQRMWGTVQRVTRAQANHAGRGRAAQDGSLRSGKYPRGLLNATAEDVPPGESTLARNVVLEVPPRDTPGGVDTVLFTAVQELGRDGTLAGAMAAFIQHLARDPKGAAEQANEALRRWRDLLRGRARHLRTPENLAQIGVGWDAYLAFGVSQGAITEEEAATVRHRVEAAIVAAVQGQDEQQHSSDPIERLRVLVCSSIASGSAHLARMDGSDPTGGRGGLGWRQEERQAGEGVITITREHGARIAWVDGPHIFMDLEAAVRVANAQAGPHGEGVVVQPKTLGKRLGERGLLVSRDPDGRNTVRRVVEGTERRLYHVHANFLGAQTDQVEPSAAVQGAGPATPLPSPMSVPSPEATSPREGACKSCAAETPENGVAYNDCPACRAVLERGGAA